MVRSRWEHGFSLVELMVAAGLLVLLVVIAADLLPDVLSSSSAENLNYQLNLDIQDIMDALEEDISLAGFRFLPPSINDDTFLALDSPGVNFLRMRCVTGSCELLVPAAESATTLTLSGYQLGADLIYTYEGYSGYLDVTAVNGNQVSLQTPLPRALPAETVLAEVISVEYQIVGTDLIRRVNGIEQSRAPIDPAGTSIRYVLDVSGDTGIPGDTSVVALLDNIRDDPNDQIDLERLLFVDIVLQLTRTGSVTRGKTIDVTERVTQRIAPLNLKTLGG